MRTFSMVVLFCGLLFSIVILCMAIVSYYTKCFVERNQLLAQTDPLIAHSACTSSGNGFFNRQTDYFQQVSNAESLINRSLPIVAPQAESLPNQQSVIASAPIAQSQPHMPPQAPSLVDPQLPSYEEATAVPFTNAFNFQLNAGANPHQSIVFARAQASTLK